jgi:hypothetical protein
MTKLSRCLTTLGLIIAAGTWACQSRINKPHLETVQGCLSKTDRGYVVSDNFGRRYYLSGSNSTEFSSNVGHQVLVQGLLVQSESEPAAPPQTTSGSENRLNVSEIKVVSASCSSK